MAQTEKELQKNIVDSHKGYYKDVDGPIGGWDRFLWVFETFFKTSHHLKILEIGCGEGSLLKLLQPKNQVIGVDISESGVVKTRSKGIECHHMDASNESMPFTDGYFDVVITLETIEHVENPHRMLWNIKKVLKQDGTLLISIPGEKVYHPFIYPGLFSKKAFSEFLKSNGYPIQKVEGWGQAPIMAHWMHEIQISGKPNKLADIIYYIGRKRNLLMRKRLGTPLSRAYCLNFLCKNDKTVISLVEQVAGKTTPLR